jgi:hypothetical protein
VGYDFYMYIGVPRVEESALSAASDLGLFVEEFESPYRVDADEDKSATRNGVPSA